MTNEIQKFYNNEFGELSVMQLGEKFWFPATECARILGYSHPKDAVTRHCKGGVKHAYLTAGGKQTVKFIPEGDLYRLIIRSKLPSAQRFETWVFDEVLPSIRKHGAYIVPTLLEEIRVKDERNRALLQELSEEHLKYVKAEERLNFIESAKSDLENQIEKDKPKLTYYDMILDNPEAVPVTLIAKDYGYGAVRFNQMLHEMGIQFCVGGTWELYQQYAGNGYTHGNVHYTKGNHAKMHTCWTQKGRLFLYEFLKEHNILPAIEVNA